MGHGNAVGGVAALHLQIRDRGLGGYPDTTLEQARDMRHQIWQRIDPVAARKAAQGALRATDAKRAELRSGGATVLACALSGIQKSDKHAKPWLSTPELYASPVLGKLPVDQIEVAHIVKMVEPIWTTKTETASRVPGRIETVLEWAKASRYRTRGAIWEIDFKSKVWTVPAGCMKAGKEHRVLLSEPAVTLLKALPRFEGSPYIFPAARGGMLSDMGISAVTRRMGLDVVPHGFHSLFKDCAAPRPRTPTKFQSWRWRM